MTSKVIVVTGASRGIGAALARWFHDRGHKVAGCSRSRPLASDSPCQQADVSNYESLLRFADSTIDRFGHIDLWINNAGVLGPAGEFAAAAPEDFQRAININLLGVMNGCHIFLNHLKKARRTGTIVNISSGAARNAYEGWSIYCASKAAVEHFTRALALEESHNGNRIFAVAPGVVDTDMQVAVRAMDAARFPMVEKFRRRKEQGDYDAPERCAAVISALAFESIGATHAPIIDARDPEWNAL